MTVCIAAICESAQAIVVASDRMITSSYPPIEFEHTASKLFSLTTTCIVMNSGDALKPIEILPKAEININQHKETPPVETIVSIVKRCYQADRISRAEELFLKPRTIDSKTFYSQGTNIFPRDMFGFIDDQFTKFQYGLDLLIAGIDQTGAHIYTINNPGISSCYDTLGFNAIGVGQLHAVQTFTAQKYRVDCSLTDAMNAVYAAKRAAETAPGVGHQTDMMVIVGGSTQEVAQSDLKVLEDIHQEVTSPRALEIEEASKKLKAAQHT